MVIMKDGFHSLINDILFASSQEIVKKFAAMLSADFRKQRCLIPMSGILPARSWLNLSILIQWTKLRSNGAISTWLKSVSDIMKEIS